MNQGPTITEQDGGCGETINRQVPHGRVPEQQQPSACHPFVVQSDVRTPTGPFRAQCQPPENTCLHFTGCGLCTGAKF